MQQALFSPGPGSCPAWALPRVMALVRVLFCLCLDTLAKISERGEGSGQFRSPHSLCSHHMPLSEGWLHLKEVLLNGSGVPVPSTYLGDQDSAP